MAIDAVALRDQFNALHQPIRGVVNELIAFVAGNLSMIEQMAQPIYGNFHGGDPRNFHPDPECSSEVEREAHKRDCDLWNQFERGELITAPEGPPSGCEFQHDAEGKVSMIICRSAYGLGTNTDSAVEERCWKLRNILRDLRIKIEE